MTRPLAGTSERRIPLDRGFALALTPPGAATRPGELPASLEWIPAPVPGTVAQALEAAGLWSRARPTPLHDRDAWYRLHLAHQGRCTLVLDGLATLAEVWLDDRLLLRSESMFRAHRLPVELVGGESLYLVFRALAPALATRPSRGRWPVPMIATPGLRHVRTTLIGHMPGWCPPVDIVGPWRGLALVEQTGPLEVRELRLRTGWAGGSARLALELAADWRDGPLPDGVALLGDRPLPLSRAGPGRLGVELELAGVEPWWPWTHGEPRLHPLALRIGGERLELGSVGFRTITVDRGPDGRGFGFRVNGVPVFARGAVWMPVDPVSLDGSRAACAPALRLLREAGANMLRVPGVAVYEDHGFHELCDELGILVWQDLMLANLDYPLEDPAWRASLLAEVEQLLDRTARHPSLALLCGGSEIAQQAAMMGQWAGAAPRWAALAREIEALVERRRPGLAFLPHTPEGGPQPFSVGEGPSHAYGVGAYLRPLAEARAAPPRFAAECLALAQLPEPASLARIVEARVGVGHDPRWKALVPRDRDASWDFEDVREHYLEELTGLPARRLRREHPERWLELSRAVSVELVRRVLGEWRRPGSPCRGALVWHARDLAPGMGFGLLDAFGSPKPAWHGMAQVLQPLQLLLTDEGLDGLALHLLNERAEPRPIRLDLVCLRDGRTIVARGARELGVAGRGSVTVPADALLAGFHDLTRAYRFGPPQHDAVVARAIDPPTGELLDEAVHLPGGLAPGWPDPGLEVDLEQDERGWALRLRCRRLARFVQVDDPAFRAARAWFHLPPGDDRLVRLEPLGGEPGGSPRGRVGSLDCPAPLAYAAGTVRCGGTP